MVNVHPRFGVPSQQVLSFLKNELSFSSRQEVVRRVTVQPVRRLCPSLNTAAFGAWIRALRLEWRIEPIALADDRLEELRVFGVVAKRPPDFADRSVDRGTVLDEYIRTPQGRLNLSAIHKDAGPPDEED